MVMGARASTGAARPALRACRGSRPEVEGREDRGHPPHEGFVLLGQKIIGRTKHGKHFVYTFVKNEALASIKRKVKALPGRSTTNLALSELIAALNQSFAAG
jgi:hypothetical protein